MASIENLTLRTLPNPGDVNLLDVRVTFTVFFSEFDFFSHLPYQECIRIFGIDTIAFAGEDNTDDLLIDGFSITTVSPPPRGIPGLNRDVGWLCSGDLLTRTNLPHQIRTNFKRVSP